MSLESAREMINHGPLHRVPSDSELEHCLESPKGAFDRRSHLVLPRPVMRRALVVLLAIGTGITVAVLQRSGPLEALWSRLFGPPDLGPIDFASLTRRRTPNDALACPAGYCPKAASDVVPPVFAVSADRLRAIVAKVAQADPDTTLVASDDQGLHDRYIARTRLMRFPDTIDVRILRQDERHATLALYSRSQIGYGDLGVNRARNERWLRAIAAAAESGTEPGARTKAGAP